MKPAEPLKPNTGLVPVLFFLLIVAGVFVYVIQFYDPTPPPEPEKEVEVFDVAAFIDKSIEKSRYQTSGVGLRDVVHYPSALTVKFRYRVGGGYGSTPIASSPMNYTVHKKRTEKSLLRRNCTHKDWQKVLKAGYKFVHAYHNYAGKKLLYSLTINKVKCMLRNYPGKNLDAWTTGVERGDIKFKSFGPDKGTSKVYSSK